MREIVLKLDNISKSYRDKVVLDHFCLEVEKGEFIIITGQSGCGKSTLLNIVGLLDKPDQGQLILFNESDVKPFSKRAEKLLKNKIGYLFQNYALIENETVYNNLHFVIRNPWDKNKKIKEVLQQVGLDHFEQKKIYQCSGGEQQRVAIARLLLKPCELILADEPTGSLDQYNKEKIMELLKGFHNQGKTIVLVTHDESIIQYASKVIHM